MSDGYQWTTDEQAFAFDAIIVRIGHIPSNMRSSSQSYVEPTACIYWPAWLGPKGQIVNADGEPGPWHVLEALDRAAKFRERFGFNRVVVAMDDQSTWREEWGTLAETEGYD